MGIYAKLNPTFRIHFPNKSASVSYNCIWNGSQKDVVVQPFLIANSSKTLKEQLAPWDNFLQTRNLHIVA